MRKAIQKLTLSRETIGGLDRKDLEGVAGGVSFKPSQCCPTFNNCPSANTQCFTNCIPCQTATGCIGTQAC